MTHEAVRVRTVRGEQRLTIDVRHRKRDGTVERRRLFLPPEVTSQRAIRSWVATKLAELDAGVDPRAKAPLKKGDDEAGRVVPTLAKFADEYLKSCSTVNRPQYARSKAAIVKRDLLPTFGAMRLNEIGTRAIDAYRAEMRKRVTAKTTNDRVSVLLHMLRTAHAWEIIDRVPKLKPLRTVAAEYDFLDDEDAVRLVAAARKVGGPWAAMILTGMRTGLRLGELRGLRWRDVDLVRGRIVVRVAADDRCELHPPKSGKPREVPLGDDVTAELKAHRHLRTHVFDDSDGGILTPSACRKAIDKITRRAGLRTIGWHCLRHTFASQLVMRGATMRAVQDLLGHGSLAMTLRYSHLSPDARRDAVRLLDRGNIVATSGDGSKTGSQA